MQHLFSQRVSLALAPLPARVPALMDNSFAGKPSLTVTTETAFYRFSSTGILIPLILLPMRRAISPCFLSPAPACYWKKRLLHPESTNFCSPISQFNFAPAYRASTANSNLSPDQFPRKPGPRDLPPCQFLRFALLVPSSCHAILYSLPPLPTQLRHGCSKRSASRFAGAFLMPRGIYR